MVAPIDAKSTFEVEGETITLRLNFRTISLAAERGINLLASQPVDLAPLNAAILCTCLAVVDHPEFTEDHGLAIVTRAPEAFGKALVDMFSMFGGKPAEGNVKGRKAKA